MEKRKYQAAGNVPGMIERDNTASSNTNTNYNGTFKVSNQSLGIAAFQRGGVMGQAEDLTMELPIVGWASPSLTYAPVDRVQPVEEIRPQILSPLPVRPEFSAPRKTGPSSRQVAVGILSLATLAFALRFSLAGLQSAYMDESSFVLTGRYLLERHEVYAGALNWTYGSYLWPLIAGLCSMAGGLGMVRLFTTLCGVLMVLATGLFAARLLPRRPDGERRWVAAFLAGLLMAVMPTGIGLGRFGTYDSLAGAAFMGGAALLIPANLRVSNTRNRRFEMLAAAALLFVAFLAKYLDAIYFPFICLALLWLGYKRRTLREQLTWFVGPLGLACLIYFLGFSRELINLLSFSTSYSDLASSQPWREYVGERLELWLLLPVALIGLWQARRERLVIAACTGGTLTLVAFQATARPDFDFWKHSIYLIFFLAPLAGLALEPLAIRLGRFFRPANSRRPAVRQILAGLMLGVAGLGLLLLSLNVSQRLVSFYPNLNPSLAAIQEQTATANKVLTNDGALRFYLYPHILTGNVTDPFYFQYKGQQDTPAYKAAITDRYFDTVVLDQGSGPQGQQLREDLAVLLQHYYRQVYSNETGNGGKVMIYQPLPGEIAPLTDSIVPGIPGSKVYMFDSSTQGWGGQPENGELQPGVQVKVSKSQLYENHPALQFQSSAGMSLVGVKEMLKIRQLKFWVYIEPTAQDNGPISVGMVGFDSKWQWHDDGFKQTITPGQWTELTWNLETPGQYNEFGLKFAGGALTAYLGKVVALP